MNGGLDPLHGRDPRPVCFTSPFRSSNSEAEPESRRSLLHDGKGRPLGERVREFFEAIRDTNRFFRNGRAIYHTPQEPHRARGLHPLTLSEFAGAMAAHFEITDGKGFIGLRTSLAQAIIQSDEFMSLPEIWGIVRHPIYGPNWQRPHPGIRSDCGLFQATES